MSSATYIERALVYGVNNSERLGVVAIPESLSVGVGVVVVVGGPQYRVGSHRQFTLLARHLAEHGIASMRFDCRGHGDSDGQPPLGDEGIDDDIRAAIDALLAEVPHLERVVLWGLCGGASVGALYAVHDLRVAGLVMLNPWVRTARSHAKAQLKYYYLPRLLDRALWARLFRGELALGSSLADVARSLFRASRASRKSAVTDQRQRPEPSSELPAVELPSLPEQMLDGLQRRRIPALVILSGADDLVANEFRQLGSTSPHWRQWLAEPHVQSVEIAGSNHTFAQLTWRGQVEDLTTRWVAALRDR